MTEEWAAKGEWASPFTVSDYLFWLEDEVTLQEDALPRHSQTTGAAHARAVRSVAQELRRLGFTPSREPWLLPACPHCGDRSQANKTYSSNCLTACNHCHSAFDPGLIGEWVLPNA
jgi:hypothetical protein